MLSVLFEFGLLDSGFVVCVCMCVCVVLKWRQFRKLNFLNRQFCITLMKWVFFYSLGISHRLWALLVLQGMVQWHGEQPWAAVGLWFISVWVGVLYLGFCWLLWGVRVWSAQCDVRPGDGEGPQSGPRPTVCHLYRSFLLSLLSLLANSVLAELKIGLYIYNQVMLDQITCWRYLNISAISIPMAEIL